MLGRKSTDFWVIVLFIEKTAYKVDTLSQFYNSRGLASWLYEAFGGWWFGMCIRFVLRVLGISQWVPESPNPVCFRDAELSGLIG